VTQIAMKNKDFYTKELPLHCVAFVWKTMANYSKHVHAPELKATFTANVCAIGLHIILPRQNNVNCAKAHGKSKCIPSGRNVYSGGIGYWQWEAGIA